MGGQGIKRRRNNAENFNRPSRAHERYRRLTDRRQTDERRHIANVDVSLRSLINDRMHPYLTPVITINHSSTALFYLNEPRPSSYTLFSERELRFTLAICHRRSVCLSHMSFRLVPNSMTLDDLEWRNSPNRRVISPNSGRIT